MRRCHIGGAAFGTVAFLKRVEPYIEPVHQAPLSLLDDVVELVRVSAQVVQFALTIGVRDVSVCRCPQRDVCGHPLTPLGHRLFELVWWLEDLPRGWPSAEMGFRLLDQ